ncbi:P2X purinoceptor 7 [Neoarius graeffei]|uniref:P2X purinoceptor 7 n=1 Tax=Neoarius graeffei TaxID=443677 RepID=UPI00298D4BA2|nr:P2X purinoceptor 7 [Neoarius graeffei]
MRPINGTDHTGHTCDLHKVAFDPLLMAMSPPALRTIGRPLHQRGHVLRENREKTERINSLINQLSPEDSKELLKKLAAGKVFDSAGAPQPDPQHDVPSWCVCVIGVARCRLIWRGSAVGITLDTASALCPYVFIQEMDHFILDEVVLHLQKLLRNDFLALHTAIEDDVSKTHHHAAYRQFILWQYGRLTVGDHHVIPSCAVWRIRDKFPDSTNTYTGYVQGLLN